MNHNVLVAVLKYQGRNKYTTRKISPLVRKQTQFIWQQINGIHHCHPGYYLLGDSLAPNIYFKCPCMWYPCMCNYPQDGIIIQIL